MFLGFYIVRRWALTVALLMAGLAVRAQNPIISSQFTADPTARVFNNKIYLYPSHDIPSPIEKLKDWFCMADYHVFSSSDLTHWEDHGVIVTQNKVPWVEKDSYTMWAPDCVEKDGTYNFYFPAQPAGRRGFAVGVATANDPTGPFHPMDKPIDGVHGIDPCVLIDDDGRAYLYSVGPGCLVGAPLKDNMVELADTMKRMEGLPDGFKEGPFAFRRGDKYYLTFPWVRKKNGTETLAYAMSDNPMGPWTFKGIIMAEHKNNCWTNHHSIVEYQGQWYLFYHHNDYSPKFDKNRSVCVDSLFFNDDGTIQEVKPTLRGVGITKASSRIQIDRYSDIQDATISYLNDNNPFEGWQTLFHRKGAWVRYNKVDFGTGATGFELRIKNEKPCKLIIRADGKVIAKVKVEANSSFAIVNGKVDTKCQGLHDLTVESASDGEVAVDWIRFDSKPVGSPPAMSLYFSRSAAKVTQPDSMGFIRSWTILEPISKPNRTNNIFSTGYLKDNLNPNIFPHSSRLPKDGAKTKVDGKTLKWHRLDSRSYNVKLFRLASGLGKQLYGVIFCMTTVVHCDKDMADIRLAVGSNGASSWWINGENVLMLNYDRRMVVDDCVSEPLTLHKGDNIVRGMLINGPGMSDFCLRFIDNEGRPVTEYKVKGY